MNEPTFEHWVSKTASALPYPPTAPVRRATRHPQRISVRPLAIGFATLLVLIGLLFVPPVRATVQRLFNLGSIDVIIEETSSPTPDAIPTVTLPDLPGETTLAAAQTNVPLTLPTISRLGDPNRVFSTSGTVGHITTLVWDDGPTVMQLLDSGVLGLKIQPEITAETTVNGERALWIEGAHLLALYDTNFGQFTDMQRLIEGNVLIWVREGVTLRLETDLSMTEAIELAESFKFDGD